MPRLAKPSQLLHVAFLEVRDDALPVRTGDEPDFPDIEG